MNKTIKKDDLAEYKFLNVTLLQWLAMLAIFGVFATLLLSNWLTSL